MKLPRRIYYVPGMISLIALLPLIAKFFYDRDLITKHNLTEITWNSKVSLRNDSISDPTLYSQLFPKGILKRIMRRKYFQVDLNGDDNDDLIKLKAAEIKIKSLISKPDSTIGVLIKFNSGTKYKWFVYASNLLLRNNVKNYLCFENEIWIFSLVHQTKESELLGSCVVIVDQSSTRITENAKTENEKMQQNIERFLNENKFHYSVILIAYFLIVFSSLHWLLLKK